MIRKGRTAVYRFFDADGGLIYVGITGQLMTRWRWHEKHADWWPEQARVEVIWHESRATAEAEETSAIRTEGPARNVQKRGKTPIRSFRVATERWAEFGAVAAAMGMTRTKVVLQFFTWFGGEAGAKVPARPTADQLAAAKARVPAA